MRLHDELRDQLKMQQMCAANQDAIEALRIEEVLRRSQEIHRERGGMFGYDFEEWLQAWGEIPERGSRGELEPVDVNGIGSIRTHLIRARESKPAGEPISPR
jgi:hypothetical protein